MSAKAPFFVVEASDGEARAGRLTTDHGEVETPIFMPVGTVGSVKAVFPDELHALGAQIILGNTYHLYLRPEREVLVAAGGLHRFMGWDGPILTDSGGFQVFSLAGLRKISEEGVIFKSHLDGSAHSFTPESVYDTQRDIGSDIMMVLDECPSADVDEAYARRSNAMTVRWAKRFLDHHVKTAGPSGKGRYEHRQFPFPIVQGVTYPEVRRESAAALVELDAPGYAIGGLSVGEPNETMYDIVSVVNEVLPASKPRYLMGVGTPVDLIENVARGIDMFDCVMPTRNARNGTLFTTSGVVNIRNRKWREDFSPIDEGLEHPVSQRFSKAYLRHLVIAGEPLAMQIASQQNLALYLWLMREMRKAIAEHRFDQFRREWQERLAARL